MYRNWTFNGTTKKFLHGEQNGFMNKLLYRWNVFSLIHQNTAYRVHSMIQSHLFENAVPKPRINKTCSCMCVFSLFQFILISVSNFISSQCIDRIFICYKYCTFDHMSVAMLIQAADFDLGARRTTVSYSI